MDGNERTHDSALRRSSPPPAPAFRLGFVAGFLLFLLAGLAVWPALSRPPVRQPIRFNHELHADAGLECLDCHPGVETAAGPGLPRNAVCADCHEEALTDSTEEAKLVDYLQRGEQVPWVPLFRKAAHVFFPHRRHVGSARLECSTCHADTGERSEPPPFPPMWLTMQECIDCHTTNQVPNDCTRCHR